MMQHEIHPLLWKPECFGLTHHLCRSNRADVAQRRGARKQRTYQSGITEEDVCRLRDKRAHVVRRDRDERTDVLIILERYINNRTGTDGHRPRSHQYWSIFSSRMASSLKDSTSLSNCSAVFPRSLFRRDRHGLLAVLAINYSSTPHYLTEESYQDSRGCLMGSLVSQFEPTF